MRLMGHAETVLQVEPYKYYKNFKGEGNLTAKNQKSQMPGGLPGGGDMLGVSN